MPVFAVQLVPVGHGWLVCLTNGEMLARFSGPGARARAARFAMRVAG